jgi:hypothetical protein
VDVVPVLTPFGFWSVRVPPGSEFYLTTVASHKGFVGFVYGRDVRPALTFKLESSAPSLMVPDAVRFYVP